MCVYIMRIVISLKRGKKEKVNVALSHRIIAFSRRRSAKVGNKYEQACEKIRTRDDIEILSLTRKRVRECDKDILQNILQLLHPP